MSMDKTGPSTVQAIRYDEGSNETGKLADLTDDGTEGDAAAGDNIFTAQIRIDEAEPTFILWGVLVRHPGQENPLRSSGPAIVVQRAAQSCSEAIMLLATAFENNGIGKISVASYRVIPPNRASPLRAESTVLR